MRAYLVRGRSQTQTEEYAPAAMETGRPKLHGEE
jgi:hypothetical protein